MLISLLFTIFFLVFLFFLNAILKVNLEVLLGVLRCTRCYKYVLPYLSCVCLVISDGSMVVCDCNIVIVSANYHIGCGKRNHYGMDMICLALEVNLFFWWREVTSFSMFVCLLIQQNSLVLCQWKSKFLFKVSLHP